MARILMLTPQLPYPPHQGTTLRNFNLIAGLSKRHSVDLLTFVQANCDGTGLDFGPLAAYCERIVTQPAPHRSLARRARDTLTQILPDMALRLDSPAMYTALAGMLKSTQYDVVQLEGIEMAPFGLALPPARPRLVFDDHNAEYVLQRRAFFTDMRRPRRWLGAAYSLVQWRKLVAYERLICRTADRVVACSQTDRDAIRRLLPGLEVTVVPNGVDLDFFRPGAAAPTPGMGPSALVYTGKMDYRPNVDAVLWFVESVLPLIVARVPDAHLYVVGQQPHSRLAPLSRHPAITVTGSVPDVRPYMAGAGVYVVPLRIGGGTRLKVLEAMAMGLPIVSTRLGCDGFPFEDGRELCLADTPVAFAGAVVALLQDRQRAAELGRAARARVAASFGWPAIVPLLEELYV